MPKILSQIMFGMQVIRTFFCNGICTCIQLPAVPLSVGEYWRSCSIPGYEYFRNAKFTKIFADAATSYLGVP
ncbi:hypothetical protein ACR780_20455 [Sphingobacterium faecium]